MTKLLKLGVITLFVVSLFIILMESSMVIRTLLYYKKDFNWSGLSYLIYSMFAFLPYFAFAGLSFLTFLEVLETKTKNVYYYLSLISIILCALPIPISIIMNFVVFRI